MWNFSLVFDNIELILLTSRDLYTILRILDNDWLKNTLFWIEVDRMVLIDISIVILISIQHFSWFYYCKGFSLSITILFETEKYYF